MLEIEFTENGNNTLLEFITIDAIDVTLRTNIASVVLPRNAAETILKELANGTAVSIARGSVNTKPPILDGDPRIKNRK